jgi:hypothetical protein
MTKQNVLTVAITTSHLQLVEELSNRNGLPAGVTGSFSGVYTINGVPQQVALFLIQ